MGVSLARTPHGGHRGGALAQRAPPSAAMFDRALPQLSTIRADLGLERSVPLPDMVFPHNYLELIRPDVGIRLVFTPQDALHSWNEQQHELSLSEDGTLDATNFDWTYGHDFRGRIDIDRAVLRTMLRTHKLIEAPYFGHPVRASIRIPDDRLRETGHIHYYSSIDLWQDELADRGVATLKVKIRVMKDLFLVLLRTFLRVDGKHVRMVDVRWFHDFAEAFMLRETSVRVATLEELRKASEGSRPFSASVSDKAQRDERFFFQEEQVYELIKPKSVTTEIVALSVGGT